MERSLIAAAVSSALAVPMAAQAVEFAVSGHVNRALIYIDQDKHAKDGELQHVDANSSGSRFRFKGSEEVSPGMTAGVNLELGVKSTGSASGTSTRHAAVFLDTLGGKLTLGHTGTAADGMAHADNAFNGGSWLAGVTNWCSYHSVGPACPTNDGDRRDVFRYDAPPLGQVSFAASAGDDEYWDAQIKLAGGFGDAGYDLRVGYIGEHDATKDKPDATVVKNTTGKDGDIFTVSGALSFGQGTSIGAAWSKDDMAERTGMEHEYFYAAVDHSYGDGSIGVYYKQGEVSDSAMPNTDGTLWGIGVGHSIGAGATVYAGYRNMEADRAEDANLFLAGMRVTFN